MSSDNAVLGSPSGSPSGEQFPIGLGTSPTMSPKDTRINAKVSQNSKIGRFLSQQKELYGDLSYEQILSNLVPDCVEDQLLSLFGDFETRTMLLQPESRQQMQALKTLFKGIVYNKKFSQDAGCEIIKLINGDDFNE